MQIPLNTLTGQSGAGASPLHLPVLTVDAAKQQKLVHSGIKARLKSNADCTVLLVVSVTPGSGKKPRTVTRALKLKANHAYAVAVALPPAALPTVRSALTRHKTITVTITATATGTGGVAAPVTTTVTLNR